MEYTARKQKLTLGAITATGFVTAFTGSGLNLAIPQIEAEFSMGAATVGWIVTIYMVAVAALSVPIGKMADRKDRRTILLGGIASFALVSALSMFAWDSLSILVMRALQGITAAMIFATNMPIAIMAYPPQKRGSVIGLVVGGTYTGLAMGPVLGGILTQHLGWRSVFFFSAAVCVVVLVIALGAIQKEKTAQSDERFDVAGSVLYIAAITCLICGLSLLGAHAIGWVLLVLFVIVMVLFVVWERKQNDPIINVRLFAKDRIYALGNVTALLNYSAVFAFTYLISIYLQVVMGYSSQSAGLLLLAQPIFMAILAPVAGRLSDKHSAQKISTAALAVSVVSLAGPLLFGAETSLWYLLCVLALSGIASAFFSTPNTNVVMSRVAKEDFSQANSILSAMRTIGQAMSMAIVTLVVNAVVGNVSLYEAGSAGLISTVHVAFAIFAVLCLVATIASFFRK